MVKRFKKYCHRIQLKKCIIYCPFTSILLHLNIHKCVFCVYHVIPSQPRFGFVHIRILNRYSFLINWFIFMKFVAKRLAIFSLSYKEHVAVFIRFLLRN